MPRPAAGLRYAYGVAAWLATLVLALVLAVGAAHAQAAADDRPSSSTEAEARALEQRLRAPCCRGQMLDAHESPAASALRDELRRRLGAGETSAAVERDLVRRYGESIVGVPLDADPRHGLSLALLFVLSISATAAFVLGARWVRRSRAAAAAQLQTTPARAEPDALDLRIEAELRATEL